MRSAKRWARRRRWSIARLALACAVGGWEKRKVLGVEPAEPGRCAFFPSVTLHNAMRAARAGGGEVEDEMEEEEEHVGALCLSPDRLRILPRAVALQQEQRPEERRRQTGFAAPAQPDHRRGVDCSCQVRIDPRPQPR